MLDKIYKQFTSTDSEKLTSEINRLKIDLTQDFGSSLTHALGSMMQLVGGADKLSAAIQAIALCRHPGRRLRLGVLALAAMTLRIWRWVRSAGPSWASRPPSPCLSAA